MSGQKSPKEKILARDEWICPYCIHHDEEENYCWELQRTPTPKHSCKHFDY